MHLFLKHILTFVLIVTGWSTLTFAQTANEEVTSALSKIEAGQAEEVKRMLPDLVAKYQNDPGVLYLQGRLAVDGIEGVKFYQSIVDNFPRSEYADDALYHIYQYYYALGLYRTAELKMDALKKEYPNSRWLTEKSIVSNPAKEEPPLKVATKDSAPQEPIRDTAPPVTPSVSEPYTLQTGAFSTSQNAEKQKSFFEDKGFVVEITNKVRGGRSLYLVWVGSFRNADDAKKFGKEVRTKYNIDSIVVERY